MVTIVGDPLPASLALHPTCPNPKQRTGAGWSEGRRSVSEIPIGRIVEPEEIANLVLFLVSEKASAITGQTIAVGGGAGGG